MDIVDHTHVSHLRYSYKHHLAVPHPNVTDGKRERGTTQHSLTNTWAVDNSIRSTRKPNDKLLIFSTLSSHCWRSYSSITTEKTIMEQLEEQHKTLVRVRDEKVKAVPAHLKLPQKLPRPKAEETAASFPGQ